MTLEYSYSSTRQHAIQYSLVTPASDTVRIIVTMIVATPPGDDLLPFQSPAEALLRF
jgi:hypothetical protein